jgi:hypothetical protein
MMKKWFFISILFATGWRLAAQPVQLPAKITEAKKTEAQRLQKMVAENLSEPLSDTTALGWQSAFWAMELMRYKPVWAAEKVKEGFSRFNAMDEEFQRAFLEWIYTNYPGEYVKPVAAVFDTIANHKLKAMCGEYLLAANAFTLPQMRLLVSIIVQQAHGTAYPSPWLTSFGVSLQQRIAAGLRISRSKEDLKNLPLLLKPGFLPGNVVVYSFQRRNRNWPGLALVRTAQGQLVKNTNGTYFSIPQLARSITNMPGYLTNGNTPTGILRMDGFDRTGNSFIGPTENIQLSLPVERDFAHFFKDSALAGVTDTLDMTNRYRTLFSGYWFGNQQMDRAFYAGWCGRTEIIAHGTTINAGYYKGASYYPQTPTLGCLCTKESWDAQTGLRLQSDQQKLVDAVKKAGGANGYLVVIELADTPAPVSLKEILPLIAKAGTK